MFRREHSPSSTLATAGDGFSRTGSNLSDHSTNKENLPIRDDLGPEKSGLLPDKDAFDKMTDYTHIPLTESTYVESTGPLLAKIKKASQQQGEGDILDKVLAEYEKEKPGSRVPTFENIDHSHDKNGPKGSQDDIEIVDVEHMENPDIQILKEHEQGPHHVVHVVRDQAELLGKGLENIQPPLIEEPIPNLVAMPEDQQPLLTESLLKIEGSYYDKAKKILKKMNEPNLPPTEGIRLEGKLNQLHPLLTEEEKEMLLKKSQKLEQKAREQESHHRRNIGQLVTGFFKDHFEGMFHDLKGMFSKKEEDIPEVKPMSFKKICKKIVRVYDSLLVEKRQEINEMFGGLFEQASAKLNRRQEMQFAPKLERKEEEMKVDLPQPPEELNVKEEQVPLVEIENRINMIRQIFPNDSEDRIREFVLKNADSPLEHIVEDYLLSATVEN